MPLEAKVKIAEGFRVSDTEMTLSTDQDTYIIEQTKKRHPKHLLYHQEVNHGDLLAYAIRRRLAPRPQLMIYQTESLIERIYASWSKRGQRVPSTMTTSEAVYAKMAEMMGFENPKGPPGVYEPPERARWNTHEAKNPLREVRKSRGRGRGRGARGKATTRPERILTTPEISHILHEDNKLGHKGTQNYIPHSPLPPMLSPIRDPQRPQYEDISPEPFNGEDCRTGEQRPENEGQGLPHFQQAFEGDYSVSTSRLGLPGQETLIHYTYVNPVTLEPGSSQHQPSNQPTTSSPSPGRLQIVE